jgi:hypothetical protein
MRAAITRSWPTRRPRAAVVWVIFGIPIMVHSGPGHRSAWDELNTTIEGMPVSRKEPRTARRDLKRGLDRQRGTSSPKPKDLSWHQVPALAKDLAVEAHLAGQPLPTPQPIELATRLLYWSTATEPYPAKTEVTSRSAVDIGDPVRDAVTAAFARQLPEPLRDALAPDRRHLHEIRDHLRNQHQRISDQLVNLPRPN